MREALASPRSCMPCLLSLIATRHPPPPPDVQAGGPAWRVRRGGGGRPGAARRAQRAVPRPRGHLRQPAGGAAGAGGWLCGERWAGPGLTLLRGRHGGGGQAERGPTPSWLPQPADTDRAALHAEGGGPWRPVFQRPWRRAAWPCAPAGACHQGWARPRAALGPQGSG